MNPLKLWSIVLLSLFISACDTEYHPTGEYGGIPHGGYSETFVSGNTVIVSFDANQFTQPALVQQYLLYRCARITMEHGYNYFVIMSDTESPMNINVQTRNTRTITTPPKPQSSSYYYEQKVTGMTTNCTSPGCRTQNLHGTTAVIKMFNGSTPSNTPRTFDALDTIAHFEPNTF